MTIRNKILVYFSTTVTLLTGVGFLIIYILFSEYREEEFQQRQKTKIEYTVDLIGEYKEISSNIALMMDKLTIHDFYDEKMMIFNAQKEPVFASIDDLTIDNYGDILNKLSKENPWYESKQVTYDIIGMYIEINQEVFLAVSKAYDAFGYSKLLFLRNMLLAIFLFIILAVIFISFYLSTKIAHPITTFADKLRTFKIGSKDNFQLNLEASTQEINYLTKRFEELVSRTNEAFEFQKHSINHISHQLKTPLSIIVSELEKIEQQNNLESVKKTVKAQSIKAKSLGETIDLLLEIAKIDSGQKIDTTNFRIDELAYDIINEIKLIFPNHNFEVSYSLTDINENNLIIKANKMLMRQVLINILTNSATYNTENYSEVIFDCSGQDNLQIIFKNPGKKIEGKEEKYIFNHFFRGDNSMGNKGFGLGLVLTKKILYLYHSKIFYTYENQKFNTFTISFPLS